MIKHIDSGHGWLQVTRDQIERFNLQDKISSFSYENGDEIYLEEDCDATLFLERFFGDENWYKNPVHKAEYKAIPVKLYAGDAPCRNYHSYGWRVKVFV